MKRITTEAIILALQNLDRMKDQVIQVVEALIYQVKQVAESEKEIKKLLFHSDTHDWHVEYNFTSPDRRQYEIRMSCFLNEGSETVGSVFSSKDKFHFKLEDAQGVHSSLQTLITGMIEKFPDLGKRLEHIIETSSK
jgi:hypothetical protein